MEQIVISAVQRQRSLVCYDRKAGATKLAKGAIWTGLPCRRHVSSAADPGNVHWTVYNS